MRYFPLFFDLRDRPVFVVGDGELAARKIRLLAKAGPRIHVFSPTKVPFGDEDFPAVCQWHARPLTGEDFAVLPALLVAASGDEDVDRAAAALARHHRVPVNVVDAPELCDVVVPTIVERGELSIGISTGGAAPVLGRRVREKIEAMLPHRLGDLLAVASMWRDRVAAAFSPSERRAVWERFFDSDAAEAALNGDHAPADRWLAALSDGLPPVRGGIHIVGAGPGDPELLTLKALRVLQEADVVLYDNLVSDAVLDLVRRDADRRYVGKRKGEHAMPQEDIGALMVSLARDGRRVVRFKGGDPYIFGRGGEEVEAARAAGLDPVVVPGITAAAGCAAEASIPLTHRGVAQAVTYVTAQAGKDRPLAVNWSALARLDQTIVVYMGVDRAGDIARHLLFAGMAGATPVAVVENGTLPTQRIIRTRLNMLASSVADAVVEGPAVLIIGEVAARADGRGLVDLATTEAAA